MTEKSRSLIDNRGRNGSLHRLRKQAWFLTVSIVSLVAEDTQLKNGIR